MLKDLKVLGTIFGVIFLAIYSFVLLMMLFNTFVHWDVSELMEFVTDLFALRMIMAASAFLALILFTGYLLDK